MAGGFVPTMPRLGYTPRIARAFVGREERVRRALESAGVEFMRGGAGPRGRPVEAS